MEPTFGLEVPNGASADSLVVTGGNTDVVATSIIDQTRMILRAGAFPKIWMF